MNKKFLSAILFGAFMLTSTGTFVSCKDYDDDIKDLQTQIDKLATKEDMTSQIASLQAALAAAQSEIAAAKTAAQEALSKVSGAEKAAAEAALAAVEAKEEAIKAAQEEVAKVKAELEATIDTKFEASQKELAATIATLTEKVEAMTGLTTKMITSIEIQGEGYYDFGSTESPWDQDVTRFYSYFSIPYAQMPAKWGDATSLTFGKGLENELVLAGGQTFSKSDEVLIAVSPANAVVSDDMLSVINSKGESLDAFLNLKAEKYTGLLVRSAANTGLYVVTASLKEGVDLKALDAALKVKWEDGTNSYTNYAIAATKDGRTVASKYNLAVAANKVEKAMCNLAEASTIKSSIKDEKPLADYNANEGTTTVNDEDCYPVVAGENFTIKVASECGDVLASYVVVDIENKNLSTTDKAAIKGLTIKGVDSVNQTDNQFAINIDGANVLGVVVPLKVVAVDYTGKTASTVVWVKAGNSAAITQTATYTITPTKFVDDPNNYPYAGIQPFKIPAGYASYELVIEDEDDDIKLTDGLSFYEDAKAEKYSTNPAKVNYAKYSQNVDLQKLVDNKVYEGNVKFYNAEGTFLGQSTIKLQKVLPTAAPAGFSIKTSQLDEAGVYNCYLIPNDWTAGAASYGTMEMSHVFNYGEVGGANYIVRFAASAWLDKSKGTTQAAKAAGNDEVVINADFIDNKTQHTTDVTYNFGAISTEKYDKDKKVFLNYEVDVESFPTVFNCIYNDTYSWNWATRAQLGEDYTATKNGAYVLALPYSTELTYGTDEVPSEEFDDFADFIFGTSARDSKYSAMLSDAYLKSLVITGATLTSDANEEAEYFNVVVEKGKIVKFEAKIKSDETNPTAAVPSTLNISVKDMYGHKFVVPVKMTVNKR